MNTSLAFEMNLSCGDFSQDLRAKMRIRDVSACFFVFYFFEFFLAVALSYALTILYRKNSQIAGSEDSRDFAST
jgi:hypothetical protein